MLYTIIYNTTPRLWVVLDPPVHVAAATFEKLCYELEQGCTQRGYHRGRLGRGSWSECV